MNVLGVALLGSLGALAASAAFCLTILQPLLRAAKDDRELADLEAR